MAGQPQMHHMQTREHDEMLDGTRPKTHPTKMHIIPEAPLESTIQTNLMSRALHSWTLIYRTHTTFNSKHRPYVTVRFQSVQLTSVG